MKFACVILAIMSLNITTSEVAHAGSPWDSDGGIATVKAGTSTTIRRWVNCNGDIPAISGAADHGKITTRVTTGRGCGKPDQKILELIYTPEQGFKGQDRGVYYYIRFPFTITITVQ